MTPTDTIEQRIERHLNLRTPSLQRLSIPVVYNQDLSVDLTINGQPFTLDLHPYSVRAAEYHLIEQQADGSYHELTPGPINTVRGEVRGLEGSIVAGGMMPDGLYARVMFPDGTDYWFEPIAPRIEGAEAGTYVVYTAENLIRGDWRCGVVDAAGHVQTDEPTPEGPTPAPRGASRYTAEVATDADYEYVTRYGSSTNAAARIQTVINTMNLQYERDVDITHMITTQLFRISASQPYTSTDPSTLLNQLSTQWTTNHAGVVRDTVHLFTGKDLDGSVIGLAYLSVICTTNFAFGHVQSDFLGTLMSSTDLSAHELGHNWNAQHCSCASPASTMNAVFTGINRFTFSNTPDTIAAITSFRNSRACLTIGGGGTTLRNDPCSGAVAISTGVFAFTNVGATNDGPATCATVGADVWYSIVPPGTGTVTVSTCDSQGAAGFDTALAAYSGSCGSLTQITCNNDVGGSCGTRSQISFSAVPSSTYLIRVSGVGGATGSGALTVSFAGGPDSCGSAQPLSSPTGTLVDTLVGAVAGGGTSCVTTTVARWYAFTAPSAGVLRVNTCGTHDGFFGGDAGIDTVLSIHSSCPGAPDSQLACNNDWNAGGLPAGACSTTDAGVARDAAVQLSMTAGQSVIVRVAGTGSLIGPYVLNYTFIPANDACASAVAVPNGTTPFLNLGATTDGPAACDITNDVWYKYTATCTGTVNVSLCGSSFDTALAVYRTFTCPPHPDRRVQRRQRPAVFRGRVVRAVLSDDRQHLPHPRRRARWPARGWHAHHLVRNLVRLRLEPLGQPQLPGPLRLHHRLLRVQR